jgi:DNA-binding NarL/FixJ family response regulator
VLRLVAEGLANKLIARRLQISERTVKAHLTNIFARIGVTDRTQAALWARDHLPSP